MKIEVTCHHCDSILSVNAEHAGKQARCPNCQNLTPIPHDSAPILQAKPTSETYPHSDFHRPSNESPAPSYINPQPASPVSSDETLSLILGFVGIIMNVGCGCLFPAWMTLNLIGFFKALGSNGSMRTACLIANGIGLMLGVAQLFLKLGWGFMAFIF